MNNIVLRKDCVTIPLLHSCYPWRLSRRMEYLLAGNIFEHRLWVPLCDRGRRPYYPLKSKNANYQKAENGNSCNKRKVVSQHDRLKDIVTLRNSEQAFELFLDREPIGSALSFLF